MNEKKGKGILICFDGSYYLYKAFHAFAALRTYHGEPTGAIYGFTKILRNFIKRNNPTHIAIVFDSKEKTFRHKIYEFYKANRISVPGELQVQIEPIKDIIAAMGIRTISISGVESDDVIGTLANIYSNSDELEKIIIASGDKDMAQLISGNVYLTDTSNSVLMDAELIKEKFGVYPNQIIEYLLLVGDTSDNIPGINGIGAKTASKLLEDFGTIENMLTNIDRVKGKTRENIEKHVDQFEEFRPVVSIKTDVELDFTLDDLIRKKSDLESIREIFNKYEINSIGETDII